MPRYSVRYKITDAMGRQRDEGRIQYGKDADDAFNRLKKKSKAKRIEKLSSRRID